jgi:hypothetical protein
MYSVDPSEAFTASCPYKLQLYDTSDIDQHRVDADPDPDPDGHQHNADPHADPTPSSTHGGNHFFNF